MSEKSKVKFMDALKEQCPKCMSVSVPYTSSPLKFWTLTYKDPLSAVDVSYIEATCVVCKYTKFIDTADREEEEPKESKT